jgi:hypothetical protein
VGHALEHLDPEALRDRRLHVDGRPVVEVADVPHEAGELQVPAAKPAPQVQGGVDVAAADEQRGVLQVQLLPRLEEVPEALVWASLTEVPQREPLRAVADPGRLLASVRDPCTAC